MKPAVQNVKTGPAPTDTAVLLAILGETPAVITETLWALAQNDTLPFPSVVSILTTQTNKMRFQSAVMDSGKWDELAALLASEPQSGQKLPLPEILVLPKPGGRDLDDIQSAEDVTQAGDFMLRWVRGYAEQPGVQILASLSGGRKTMAALFSTCMTLLGREKDRMLHVHVNPPFDRPMDPPFLFPAPNTRHKAADGKSHPSNAAHVNLFEVPFVRLNILYTKTWGHAPSGFKQLIGQVEAEQRTRSHTLCFNPDEQRLEVDNLHVVSLSPLEVEALKYLWSEMENFSQGWGGNDDHRTAAGRVKSKLRKLGWGEADIEEFIPNFRKQTLPNPWPPANLAFPA